MYSIDSLLNCGSEPVVTALWTAFRIFWEVNLGLETCFPHKSFNCSSFGIGVPVSNISTYSTGQY